MNTKLEKKYFYIASILFLFFHPMYGQDKILTGWIVDELELPVEFINVSISEGDSIISITQTDSLGIYKIQFSHPNDTFNIKLLSWGIEIHLEEIVFPSNTQLIKNIKLKDIHSIALKEVEIKANQPIFVRKNDRYVYQPEISILKSSTAFDVLKQTPMLKVSDDDISLIFKENTKIYLNSRPLRMPIDALVNYLKSTPSDNIKNIEIITNPGSQFDASHQGGIINIILHKNENDGFLGRLAFRDMQGRYNSQIATFSFEFKKNKFGLQGSITGNNSQHKPKQITEIIESNGNNQHIISHDYNKNKGVNFDLNAEYRLNKQHILNFFTTNRISPYKGASKNYTDYGHNTSPNIIDSTVFTNINSDGITRNNFFNLSYLYKIDEKGQQLDINTDYMDYNRKTNQYTDFYLVEKNERLINRNKLYTHTLQDIQSFSIKTDYSYPSEKLNINIGGLYTNYKADNHTDIRDYDNGNTRRNISFNYQEHIGALYANADYRFSGKINLAAGIRGEYTKINFDLIDSDMEKNKSNYFNVYPSVHFNYNINDKWTLNYSLSTKVQRPTSWQLNPFVTYLNQNSYTSGNSELEKINTYNQELIFAWNNQYSLNINHSYSKNDIGQFFVPDPIFSHLNYYGFFNYGDRNNVYIYINMPVNLFNSFWKLNVSTGAQYSYYKISNSGLDKYYKNTNSINGIFYVYNTFQLSPKNNLWAYMNFQYFSPNMYLVKENIAYPSFNMEIKKSWTDWSISLLGNYGVYNGKGISKLKPDQHFSPYLKERYTLYPDFNHVGIRLAYSFGNSKVKTGNQTKIANKDIQNRVQ